MEEKRSLPTENLLVAETKMKVVIESRLKGWISSLPLELERLECSMIGPHEAIRIFVSYDRNGNSNPLDRLQDYLSDQMGLSKQFIQDNTLTFDGNSANIEIPSILVSRMIARDPESNKILENALYPPNENIPAQSPRHTDFTIELREFLEARVKGVGGFTAGQMDESIPELRAVFKGISEIPDDDNIVITFKLGTDVDKYLRALGIEDRPEYYTLQHDQRCYYLTLSQEMIEPLLREQQAKEQAPEADNEKASFASRFGQALARAFSTPHV